MARRSPDKIIVGACPSVSTQMNFDGLQALCKAQSLAILGGFHPEDDAHAFLHGFQTLLLLGPDEPGFWQTFRRSPEFHHPDNPMDRWSKRVIDGLAKELGGRAFFPSDGPPYPPFFAWAKLTKRCHSSPVNLLVHDNSGMLVSFRGSLALPFRVALPDAPPPPCGGCIERSCQTACPISALTPDGYDVEACKTYLRSDQGKGCMKGCKVRLACPVSKNLGRLPEQSEFHQRAFLKP